MRIRILVSSSLRVLRRMTQQPKRPLHAVSDDRAGGLGKKHAQSYLGHRLTLSMVHILPGASMQHASSRSASRSGPAAPRSRPAPVLRRAAAAHAAKHGRRPWRRAVGATAGPAPPWRLPGAPCAGVPPRNYLGLHTGPKVLCACASAQCAHKNSAVNFGDLRK